MQKRPTMKFFSTKTNSSSKGTEQLADANLFSKNELENLIRICAKISILFRDSKILIAIGRNEKMMSRIHAYAGIFGYYYEKEYNYGTISSVVYPYNDPKMITNCIIAMNEISNEEHRQRCVKELADNWSDVLQVIFNFQLEQNSEGDQFRKIKSDIQKVTSAIEKLSGSTCRTPKDPRTTIPKVVSYNPMKITEDPIISAGHLIPDMTNIFARELIPQLINARYTNHDSKDIVAKYTLEMIKSYYRNAGFVPMVIIDQITGQISQVADMAVQDITYTPYASLKEYVLSFIYK